MYKEYPYHSLLSRAEVNSDSYCFQNQQNLVSNGLSRYSLQKSNKLNSFHIIMTILTADK